MFARVSRFGWFGGDVRVWRFGWIGVWQGLQVWMDWRGCESWRFGWIGGCESWRFGWIGVWQGLQVWMV